MTTPLSCTVKPEGATYVIAVHNVDGMKLLNDGYYVVMLDGCHLRRSAKMLRDKDGIDCVVEPLGMRYTFRDHVELIF